MEPKALPGDEVPECPYRGLLAFREEDSLFFHGRDREVTRLVQLVDHQPVVVVAGPSGCGKSSVVRAGLWPVLRQQNVALSIFRPIPGVAPNLLLVSALRSVVGPELAERLNHEELPLLVDPIVEAVGELVLFVDQFEEIAAADPPAAIELFDLIMALVEATPPRPGKPPALRVVVTVRSAELDEVLTPELTSVLEHAAVYVRSMGSDDLYAAITEPAYTAGVSLEPGLVERITEDAANAPGQLALVEFTLTRLWDKQNDGVLTHQAYNEIGTIAGALATYAEEGVHSGWALTCGVGVA